jgi:hypothetical protein
VHWQDLNCFALVGIGCGTGCRGCQLGGNACDDEAVGMLVPAGVQGLLVHSALVCLMNGIQVVEGSWWLSRGTAIPSFLHW